jgi:hypothetical protein
MRVRGSGLAFRPHRALHPHPTSLCCGEVARRTPAPALAAAGSARCSPTPRMSAANSAAEPLPTTIPRVHMPNLPCPGAAAGGNPAPLRLQIVSLRLGRAAARRRLPARGKARLAALAGHPRRQRRIFALREACSRRGSWCKASICLGEARRRMAHGSGGARKGLPARCGRNKGLGRAPCGQRRVDAAETSDQVAFLRHDRDDSEFPVKLWVSGGGSRDNRTRRPG